MSRATGKSVNDSAANQRCTPRKKWLVVAATACILLACKPRPAGAEALWPIDQNFNIGIGWFLVNTDTSVRVDGHNNTRGTEVNLEHEFGFENQDRFRIDGYWRFLKRHKLRFMYFDNRIASSRSIDREIEFGDTVFPINAEVRAELETQIFEIAYEYSFVQRDSFELAGTAGIHDLKLTTRLSATSSGTQTAGGFDRSSTADGNGPLPVIGLRALWALNDQLYFDAQAQFFALKVNQFDGSLHDYKITFTWQPLRHVGVGFGYNEFVTRLDVELQRFNGRLQFQYGGPMVFVNTAF